MLRYEKQTSQSSCNKCSYLEKSNIPHFETSAKEGTNVDKAFETVARNALAREKDIDPSPDFPEPRIRIPVEDEKPQTNKCPC